MEVVTMKVSELKEYERNPRKNDDAVEYVANSIKEFGFKVPIVIDKDNVIVAGHTRLKAAKLLKMNEVPVIVADDLTEEQVKAFRLADNKTAEFADWDFDALIDELDGIMMDMEDFGFDEKFPDIDLDELFEEHIGDYNIDDDITYLKWGDKKVEVDDVDIEFLDNNYHEWTNSKTGISFVSWLGDNI